ncbi:hypothetical protein [Ekhidna sp.]
MDDERIKTLEEQLEQAKENQFLSQNDLDFARTENIAMKNFIQNLYVK